MSNALFLDKPRFWPNGAAKVADSAAYAACWYACRGQGSDGRMLRRQSWALFIDALMEAPEVTDE